MIKNKPYATEWIQPSDHLLVPERTSNGTTICNKTSSFRFFVSLISDKPWSQPQAHPTIPGHANVKTNPVFPSFTRRASLFPDSVSKRPELLHSSLVSACCRHKPCDWVLWQFLYQGRMTPPTVSQPRQWQCDNNLLDGVQICYEGSPKRFLTLCVRWTKIPAPCRCLAIHLKCFLCSLRHSLTHVRYS